MGLNGSQLCHSRNNERRDSIDEEVFDPVGFPTLRECLKPCSTDVHAGHLTMSVTNTHTIPDEMRAVVLHGPDEWTLETVETPTFDGVANVICRVECATICGTDPKIFSGHTPGWPPEYPFIPGHEIAGTVVAVDKSVNRFEPGDRVFAETHSGCGYCDMCRNGRYNLCENYGDDATGHRQIGHTMNGGFAEYLAVPEDTLHHLNEALSWREGALLDINATALQCAVRGGIQPGDHVAVLGTGTLGLLSVQYATLMGASKVIGIDIPERLELAGTLGATETISYETEDVLERVKSLTDGVGVDVTIEAVGTAATFQQSIDITRNGGVVSLLGVPKDDRQSIAVGELVKREIDYRGTRAHANYAGRSARLVEQDQIDVDALITHEFEFDDFEEAFETFAERKDGAIKVALSM